MQFAEYANQTGHCGPLTTELAVRWAGLPENASGSHLARRLDAVRGFARYRYIFDSVTEIPPCDVFGPAYRRKMPCIFSLSELAVLLQEARRLTPENSLRPQTYSTYFGLLACTGLRNGEARRLTLADVDFQRELLHVRETKFRKSRLLPLHDSTLQVLKSYARLRDRFFPIARSDSFFVTLRGTALSYPAVYSTFSQLREQLNGTGRTGRRLPRIHDLRHTFACRRLLQWHQQGVDVNHAIASLSTYLGHASINDTYWYLTGIPELLALAGSRFEQFTSSDPGDAS